MNYERLKNAPLSDKMIVRLQECYNDWKKSGNITWRSHMTSLYRRELLGTIFGDDGRFISSYVSDKGIAYLQAIGFI